MQGKYLKMVMVAMALVLIVSGCAAPDNNNVQDQKKKEPSREEIIENARFIHTIDVNVTEIEVQELHMQCFSYDEGVKNVSFMVNTTGDIKNKVIVRDHHYVYNVTYPEMEVIIGNLPDEEDMGYCHFPAIELYKRVDSSYVSDGIDSYTNHKYYFDLEDKFDDIVMEYDDFSNERLEKYVSENLKKHFEKWVSHVDPLFEE